LWEVIPAPEDPVRLGQYKELLFDILLDADNVRGMYDLSTKVRASTIYISMLPLCSREPERLNVDVLRLIVQI